jgi:hypothetical protein
METARRRDRSRHLLLSRLFRTSPSTPSRSVCPPNRLISTMFGAGWGRLAAKPLVHMNAAGELEPVDTLARGRLSVRRRFR